MSQVVKSAVKPPRIASLDIFRFVAALSVVFFHFLSSPSADVPAWMKHIAQFGYLGVPLFFVISGYVIAMSADGRSAIGFAWARFLRLYPIYWLGVLYTVSILFFVGAQTFDMMQVLANLTMLNDYISIPDIDGVYWTLHAELKFYGCIFILIAFGFYKYHQVWLVLWLVCAMTYFFSQQPFFMGWFITPFYSSYFIAGVAFYLLKKQRSVYLAHIVIVIALALSIRQGYEQAFGFLFRTDVKDLVVVVVIHAAIYMLFYLLVFNRLNIRSNRYFEIAGQLTYPLYLVHNVAGKALIDEFSPIFGYFSSAMLVTLISLGVSYLLVVLSEKLIIVPLKNKYPIKR